MINRDISPLRDLDHHLEIRAEPFYAPATSSLLTLTEHLQYRNLRGGIGKKKITAEAPTFSKSQLCCIFLDFFCLWLGGHFKIKTPW